METTKRRVKTLRIGDLKMVKNKNIHFWAAKKLNHLRVRFSKASLDLLFTDYQIERGLHRSSRNPEDLTNLTWVHKLLQSEVIDTQRKADMQKIINKNRLPNAAHTYNHIVIELCDENDVKLSDDAKIYHLLFTDHEIDVARSRAEKNPENIPSVSWLRNTLDRALGNYLYESY